MSVAILRCITVQCRCVHSCILLCVHHLCINVFHEQITSVQQDVRRFTLILLSSYVSFSSIFAYASSSTVKNNKAVISKGKISTLASSNFEVRNTWYATKTCRSPVEINKFDLQRYSLSTSMVLVDYTQFETHQ